MKLNDLVKKALENIDEDRKAAKELLEGVAEHIGQSADRYKESGMVAAKYLETLQRSNEQLVKIAELRRKGNEEEFGELTDSDKDDLFSEIEEGGDEEV
jgi:hypothetical protein